MSATSAFARCATALAASFLVSAFSGDAHALAHHCQQTSADRCAALNGTMSQLRWLEEAIPRSEMSERPVLQGWKLTRMPNARGGTDSVSMVRPAEPSRSDSTFAGLMLRCGSADIEVLLVVVRPLPPRAKPHIVVRTGSHSASLEASVIPPGAALLLGPPASNLIRSSWQSAEEAEVEIRYEESIIRGVVSLFGIGAATRTLLLSCPPHQP